MGNEKMCLRNRISNFTREKKNQRDINVQNFF